MEILIGIFIGLIAGVVVNLILEKTPSLLPTPLPYTGEHLFKCDEQMYTIDKSARTAIKEIGKIIGHSNVAFYDSIADARISRTEDEWVEHHSKSEQIDLLMGHLGLEFWEGKEIRKIKKGK